MAWFDNLKMAHKLAIAFGVCALITSAVGFVGKQGLTNLNQTVESLLEQNLKPLVLVNDAKSALIAHDRDLYWLMTLAYRGAAQSELDRALEIMRRDISSSEDSFSKYRRTQLHNDERIASDAFEEHKRIYLEGVDAAKRHIAAKNLLAAYAVLESQAFPAYLKVMADMNVMVDSKQRQGIEAYTAARVTHSQADFTLGIGVALAVFAALMLAIIITRLITRPIEQAVASAERIAEGDLTQPSSSERRDEAGQLLQALEAMRQNLKVTVEEMASASSQLALAAQELNKATEESSQGVTRQHDEVQQAAIAVNQMAAAAEEVARNAVSTSEASMSASQDVENGRVQVKQAVDAINTMTHEITESTAKVQTLENQIHDIGEVLDVIRGVAEQTNLLALNAAIEAARAGEQGRGFAVVADEVRALAHRTQGSTGEIERMMNSVRTGAQEAVRAMTMSQALTDETHQLASRAGQALDRIAEGVGRINERNIVIASASEEQAQVAREVDRNLVNIQDLSIHTAAGAQQTAASSQELSRLAKSLGSLVEQFRY
nr:methyl-accepting chemotaxis protein [Pseudomonas akapageensis]